MEDIKLNKGCNRDVPVEQTIHYIVKDYRRMYHGWEAMEERIASLEELLRKHENEAYHRGRRIEKLWDRLDVKQKEIDNLKAKLGHKVGRKTPPPIL